MTTPLVNLVRLIVRQADTLAHYSDQYGAWHPAAGLTAGDLALAARRALTAGADSRGVLRAVPLQTLRVLTRATSQAEAPTADCSLAAALLDGHAHAQPSVVHLDRDRRVLPLVHDWLLAAEPAVQPTDPIRHIGALDVLLAQANGKRFASRGEHLDRRPGDPFTRVERLVLARGS